ncbi:MAG: hypothetical protein A2Y33_04810 [Spirochaetes bacterium GWF1_51_8]|nr:MAG: hypothetical protein A2Y33_04810 [Spirochaetes bacterium GWF1_51_8]
MKKMKSKNKNSNSFKKLSLLERLCRIIKRERKQNIEIDATDNILSIMESNKNNSEKYRNLHLVFGSVFISILYILKLEFQEVIILLNMLDPIFPFIIYPILFIVPLGYVFDFISYKFWVHAKRLKTIRIYRFDGLNSFFDVLFFLNTIIFIWSFFIMFSVSIVFVKAVYQFSRVEDIQEEVNIYLKDYNQLPNSISNLNLSKEILSEYHYKNFSNYYSVIFHSEVLLLPRKEHTNYFMIKNNEAIAVINLKLIGITNKN